MLTALLAWLYGQALIGCAVAVAAWARLAWRRWKAADRPSIADDAYLWIATGIVCVLGGIVAGTTSRAWTFATTGDVAIGTVPALLILSLTLVSCGAAALVWGSTIARSPIAWRVFAGLTVVHAVGTLIWRL